MLASLILILVDTHAYKYWEKAMPALGIPIQWLRITAQHWEYSNYTDICWQISEVETICKSRILNSGAICFLPQMPPLPQKTSIRSNSRKILSGCYLFHQLCVSLIRIECFSFVEFPSCQNVSGLLLMSSFAIEDECNQIEYARRSWDWNNRAMGRF